MNKELRKQYLSEFRAAYSTLLLKAHQLNALFESEAGENRPSQEQFELILKRVANAFGIDPALLLAKKRPEELNNPRFFAMALMRELLPVSHGEIGRFFNRDAGCSRNACRRVHETLRLKPVFNAGYIRLRNTLPGELLVEKKTA